MTLTELAGFVTDKLGVPDAYHVALCKRFIKRRYRMIADSFNWNDTQKIDSATVTGGTSSVAMPASMDRVISVRANGKLLDPYNAADIMQLDPAILDTAGTPKFFEVWADSAASDARKIKVYPYPAADTVLYVVGKRLLADLADGTSSVIGNIDNCLLAYGEFDMLQKLRQYGKAKEKLEEASALLEQAKALETKLANRPRAAKGLTVAGNSLAELADAVCARCGAWSPDDAVLAKEFLRRNYQAVYDGFLWKESRVAVNVASDGEQLVLPHYIDRVISLRADSHFAELGNLDIEFLFTVWPTIFEATSGRQSGYSLLAPVGVKVLPPGNEQLSFVSDSVNDKSPIRLMGMSAGDEVSETVTLNGLAPVISAHSYDEPLTIAKQATEGVITVTGVISAVELQVLQPSELERKHIRIWLHPPNTTGATCLVAGKRRINPFVTDEDTPLLRAIQGPLIDLAVADMFDRPGGDMKKADSARERGMAGVKRLVDLETKQGADMARIIPYAEPIGCSGGRYGYDSANFLS